MEQAEVMEWMMQIESAAEDILADRQHIVNLDRQRQDTRQALRWKPSATIASSMASLTWHQAKLALIRFVCVFVQGIAQRQV